MRIVAALLTTGSEAMTLIELDSSEGCALFSLSDWLWFKDGFPPAGRLTLGPLGPQQISECCHSPLCCGLGSLGGRLHEQDSHSAASMLSKLTAQCCTQFV